MAKRPDPTTATTSDVISAMRAIDTGDVAPGWHTTETLVKWLAKDVRGYKTPGSINAALTTCRDHGRVTRNAAEGLAVKWRLVGVDRAPEHRVQVDTPADLEPPPDNVRSIR